MIVLAKKYAVWIALVLTLMATLWVSQKEDAENVVVLPKERPTRVSLQVDKQKQVALTRNEQLLEPDTTLLRVSNDSPQNLFTVLAPPPVPSTGGQNVAPTMPANPYVYAGKIIDGTQMTVFLLSGENGYAVKVGDVLDEVWKVKTIKPPNMTLRYVPLKIDTQLDIGVVN
ncbi:MAG TPA: hypothetical protein PLJ94_07750 [Methylotenera sp.]|nr:hypothetical protein [Methylotenera sp.]HPH08556.1 hypothetical protein [Methylotenera sp.]HPM48690.1 hypothetical protein [Methylotenera sp.]